MLKISYFFAFCLLTLPASALAESTAQPAQPNPQPTCQCAQEKTAPAPAPVVEIPEEIPVAPCTCPQHCAAPQVVAAPPAPPAPPPPQPQQAVPSPCACNVASPTAVAAPPPPVVAPPVPVVVPVAPACAQAVPVAPPKAEPAAQAAPQAEAPAAVAAPCPCADAGTGEVKEKVAASIAIEFIATATEEPKEESAEEHADEAPPAAVPDEAEPEELPTHDDHAEHDDRCEHRHELSYRERRRIERERRRAERDARREGRRLEREARREERRARLDDKRQAREDKRALRRDAVSENRKRSYAVQIWADALTPYNMSFKLGGSNAYMLANAAYRPGNKAFAIDGAKDTERVHLGLGLGLRLPVGRRGSLNIDSLVNKTLRLAGEATSNKDFDAGVLIQSRMFVGLDLQKHFGLFAGVGATSRIEPRSFDSTCNACGEVPQDFPSERTPIEDHRVVTWPNVFIGVQF